VSDDRDGPRDPDDSDRAREPRADDTGTPDADDDAVSTADARSESADDASTAAETGTETGTETEAETETTEAPTAGVRAGEGAAPDAGPGGSLTTEERVAAGVVGAAAVALVGLVATGLLDLRYLFYLLSLAGTYVLLSMGLNVQWGYTGLINFSVAAFFGVGAYGVALATSSASPVSGDLSPATGLVAGLVCAGVLAVLVGVPTLSLDDDYLAIATLGLAEVVRLVLLTETQWTNGSTGLYGIPRLYADWPVLGEFSRGVAEPATNFAVVLVAVAAVWLLLRRVHLSPWGRVQRLVRTDEELAAALGKNTYRLRLQSFVIGSLVMALAGALYASAIVFVDPSLLSPVQTFYVWIAVIIGGTGSDRGAMLGGALVIAIVEGTREVGTLAGVSAGPLRLFLIGALILLVIRLRPQGVLPPRRELVWPGTEDEP
jgi:branched-chain amino acid transport system permease protein